MLSAATWAEDARGWGDTDTAARPPRQGGRKACRGRWLQGEEPRGWRRTGCFPPGILWALHVQ